MARFNIVNSGFPKTIAAVGGLVFVGFGIWAMAGPESFFNRMAVFEPFNRHFVQDLGAFQIGLGVTLLMAAYFTSDALVVALLGTGTGAMAHVVSHLSGMDLGGTPAFDIPALSVLGVVLVMAGSLRWRHVKHHQNRT